MGFSRAREKNVLINISRILLPAVLVLAVILLKPWAINKESEVFVLRSVENSPEIKILSGAAYSEPRDRNLYRYEDDKGVPISTTFSSEFIEILQTIYESPYYVSDPKEACILVPSIDLLNQDIVRLKETSQVLATLPFWNSGMNHLLFFMLPGSVPHYNPVLEIDSHKAILAGAGFSSWTYRKTFDISIPTLSLINQRYDSSHSSCHESSRRWLATSAAINIHFEYRHELEDLAEEHPELLVLGRCSEESNSQNSSIRCRGGDTYSYPEIYHVKN